MDAQRLSSGAWGVICVLVCFWAVPGKLAAQHVSQEDLLKEVRELKETVRKQAARIDELERRIAAGQPPAPSGALPSAVEKKAGCEDLPPKEEDRQEPAGGAYPWLEGVDVGGWSTMIVQAATHANGPDYSGGDTDVTDASYTLDLTVEKKFGDYACGFVHMRAGNGSGLNDDLQLFSNVNYNADDAGNDVRVIEAWYEQYLRSGLVTLTVGKLDPLSYIDDNLYAYDETTQFLGDMFCNSPTIEFPPNIGEAGLRLGLRPWESVGLELLATDSYGTGEDVFDALFLAGQVTFSPAVCSRSGNYRFLVWENGADHTRWTDPAKTKEHSYGWGLSFDQEFSDCLGVFFRYGWQNPDVYLNGEEVSLARAYTLGSQVKGVLWGRAGDAAGLGFGQVFASKKYKQVQGAEAKPETHLECYYNFRVNKHLTISPDVQVIWDPYGADAVSGDDTLVVTGIRGELDF